MVELIEYVLVLGISAGLAGMSVMLVSEALPGLNQLAASSKSDQIAGAARVSSIERREVALVLPLQDTSVSCSDGSLSVTLGGASRVYELGFPCSFDYGGLDGACTLDFLPTSASLQLTVEC